MKDWFEVFLDSKDSSKKQTTSWGILELEGGMNLDIAQSTGMMQSVFAFATQANALTLFTYATK